MEFTLETKAVNVPTEVIVLNGVRLSPDEFASSLQALQAIGKADDHYPKGLDRRELRHLLQTPFESAWVKQWEDRKVIETFRYYWDTESGGSVTEEMVKAGPAYPAFMRAAKAFQVKLASERTAAAEVARRTDLKRDLKRQLKALDKPPTKRSARTL